MDCKQHERAEKVQRVDAVDRHTYHLLPLHNGAHGRLQGYYTIHFSPQGVGIQATVCDEACQVKYRDFLIGFISWDMLLAERSQLEAGGYYGKKVNFEASSVH